MTQRVRVLIQTQRGKVLTVHSHETTESGEKKCVFNIPCGVINEGESLVDAAKRVLKEQTGLVPADIIQIYQADEDGVDTITVDTDIKKRRDVIHTDDVMIDFTGVKHLVNGPQGEYNRGLFTMLGMDFSVSPDEELDMSHLTPKNTGHD
jgi:hypothetical protein